MKLKPCHYDPKHEIVVEPWHGGGPDKHMVSCVDESCDLSPGVTGETKAEAIERWNNRPLEQAEYKRGRREALESALLATQQEALKDTNHINRFRGLLTKLKNALEAK